MNLQLKQKLSIKNAMQTVYVGYRIYKAVEFVQWLCENIPW